ncbi:Murein DD-endopeptidase MepM [Tsuneonella dongtanensis]|uniref:Murein DD-endopeptidase MepM n=1 Tax=Tsuneonella dongtanensis TaxID=692370 RepID=A0A1B2AA39_9SPHN|nr:M23 family metallopeptidase [Tsuneonella dongtanensis]ANY18971.1 Murein DD-endopeptidase MepM [Tsuneonella dongtanensis]
MNAVAGGWLSRLRTWFPDREFFMRSQGQVRFIKITGRVQMIAAGAVVSALVLWGLSMAVMGWLQYRAAADRLSLLEREATVAKSEERVGAYRANIQDVADDLKARQDFLEEMTEALPDDVKNRGTVSDSSGEAAKTVSKVSAMIPEAAALAAIEARQLAYVEKLTRYADQRAERSARAIRQLGLDPNSMMRAAGKGAMGGPLERLASDSDGSLDPRFERLGASLARMEALDRSLSGIPQYRPAAHSMTSSFGVRRDPFNGTTAMHAGIDFSGPTGAPIYAAAKGRVSFVGQKSGYGNVVEISHGNGMITRYAHMSKFHSRVGQEVAAGDVIGAIGSTGRSTGPHLHFEVRVNDRAVNPRPFLEAAPHVLKEARRVQPERDPARG